MYLTKRRLAFFPLFILVELFLMYSLWGVINPFIIWWRASNAVGSNPYCIEIPDFISNNYKYVSNWQQLYGNNMRGLFGWAFPSPFYAVLLDKTDDGIVSYNWSFRQENFIPIVGYWVPFVAKGCTPVQNFFGGLQ